MPFFSFFVFPLSSTADWAGAEPSCGVAASSSGRRFLRPVVWPLSKDWFEATFSSTLSTLLVLVRSSLSLPELMIVSAFEGLHGTAPLEVGAVTAWVKVPPSSRPCRGGCDSRSGPPHVSRRRSELFHLIWPKGFHGTSPPRLSLWAALLVWK